MEEIIIKCPECKKDIPLTASLAAPLLESTRAEYEARLDRKEQEFLVREGEISQKEAELKKEQSSLKEQIEKQLKEERAKIAKSEAEKIRREFSLDLEDKEKALADLQETLSLRETKLKEAQQAQVEAEKKRREFEDKEREMDLTIQKKINEGLNEARDKARREGEETLSLKVKEKEETINAMSRQIEELKRKAEQGSQQLQGEVLELELEQALADRFKTDIIDPVPKGEFGGDVLQRVLTSGGVECGLIIWESKRTKNFSETWLTKLSRDQAAAKADFAILITQTLPKGVESFDLMGNIWVAHPSYALPLAVALRNSLVELQMARSALQGQESKADLVYEYLTGPRFKQRIRAIVEAFESMKTDLDKERRAIQKQWIKREEQIERVVQGTIGMMGDLQGIAGTSIQEIEGLSFDSLLEE